ncbi:MAG: PCYCGC motif-containing (lipo)protein [Gemmatimonadaceae bacterium]
MVARRDFFVRASALAALLGIDRNAFARAVTRRRPAFPHPDPRPGITGERVLADSELGERRRVREAYAAARTHPEIFDGVYCACECDKSMNHRSLLSCFESPQAIGCRACREEAELVARLARDGKPLDEIRRAVDEEFGG